MFVDNPVKHYEALARYWRRIGEFGIAQRMSTRAEEFRRAEKAVNSKHELERDNPKASQR